MPESRRGRQKSSRNKISKVFDGPFTKREGLSISAEHESIKQHLDQIESICYPVPEPHQTMYRAINALQLYIMNKMLELPNAGLVKSVLKEYIFDREILELKGKEMNGEMNSEQVYNSLMEFLQKNGK